MNILVYDCFGSFQTNDVLYFLNKMGHSYDYLFYKLDDRDNCPAFEEIIGTKLNDNSYDFVFTTNYIPLVARICNEHEVSYCAWVYDSPPQIETLDTLPYKTNQIFFFTKADYNRYKNMGLDNVHYLPLAVNTDRLDGVEADVKLYGTDISFVGGLYSSSDLLSLKAIMSDDQKKYLDEIIYTQLKHSGSTVIDSALTDEVVDDICKHYRELSPKAIQPSRDQFFFAVCQHMAHIERVGLLRLCSLEGHTRLYTAFLSDTDRMLLEKSNVELFKAVDYEKQMPQVFKCSSININTTVRANRTGIPLRVVDVLGARGFLLSNFQQEMGDWFKKDEICTYDSMEEAIEKVRYYLKNEDKRKHYINAGYERVKTSFRYEDRLMEIIKSVTIE